jgi:predicted house-cleaning noncanonical NTP pyrophosphatase (MazG superfamily)
VELFAQLDMEFSGVDNAALHDKLDEEAAELRSANSADKVMEEAADVLEVLIGLAALHGRTLDDILRVASNKRSDRGGFDERLWLERP